MSVPLFYLIVVNERVMMGAEFVYATDRYMLGSLDLEGTWRLEADKALSF